AKLNVKGKDVQKGVVKSNKRIEQTAAEGDKTLAASGNGGSSEVEGVKVGEVLLRMGDGKEKEQRVKRVTETAAKPLEAETALVTGVYMRNYRTSLE
ncbi:hypothetical protein A2U01_0074741, partial [Trifolium medium]|nr:hypothetical protein [Trifolium medium]